VFVPLALNWVLPGVALEDEVVHEDRDVRKGSDERLRDVSYRSRLAAVDGDRPARGIGKANLVWAGVLECPSRT
jgi:hypothetical protein